MSYLLDTNTLSFSIQGHPDVLERLLSEARHDVLLPHPVVAEIEYGLSRLPPSSRRHRALRRNFDALRRQLRMADWTDGVSRSFGKTKADLTRRGLLLEDFDIAIAAHALALNATLVTDNLAHMKRIQGLRLENWKSRPA